MEKRALRKALKLAIETLVHQEIRLLRLGQVDTPTFVVQEVSYAIRESKRQVIDLTQSMAHKEKVSLIKKLIQQAVDDEIERSLQMRKIRCLRCSHMRYYDRERTPYVNFPIGIHQVEVIGCDEVRPAGVECNRFVEKRGARSLGDHLDEMALLYELRATLLQIKKIWEEYLINP